MSGRWVALLVTLAVGCAGGESNDEQRHDAQAYDGFWILDSVTVDGGRSPVTYVRNGGRSEGLGSLRGDMRFVAHADDTAQIVGRMAFLSEGVFARPPEYFSKEVRVDGSTWFVGLEVVDAEIDGDRLILTRHFDVGEMPRRITARRAVPWDDRTAGQWEVSSLVLPDVGRLDAGACLAVDSRGIRLEQAVRIDRAWMLVVEQTVTTYADPQCVQIEGTSKTERIGIVEEERDRLRIWDFEPGDPASAEFVEFELTFVRSNASVVLEQTDCLPVGCKARAPTRLVLVRAGER